MRERSLKRRTAFILAVLLTFMNCFSSFASETVDDTDNPQITEELNNTDEVAANTDNEASDEGDPSGAVSVASSNEAEDETKHKHESITVSTDDIDLISEDDNEDDEDPVSENGARLQTLFRLGSSPISLLGDAPVEPGLNNDWAEKEGILWKLSGNTLVISENMSYYDVSRRGYMGESGFSWTPNEEGTEGTGEGEWLPYASQITKVQFYGNIKNIASYAFAGTNITGIDIPDTVTKIGVGAFVDCKKISVIGVNNNPHFYSNTDAGSSGDGVLYQINDDGSRTLLFCPVKTYKAVIVSDNTALIGDYAFYGCSYLPSVKIPGSVVTIGSGAFMGCSSLTEVVIGKRGYDPQNEDYSGNSLSRIAEKAFKMCAKLKYIYIPDKLKDAANDIFKNDSNLSYVIVYATDPSGSTTDLNKAYFALSNAIEVADTSKKNKNSYVKEVKVPYNHCILFFDNGNTTYDPITVLCGNIADRSKFPTPEKTSTTGQNYKFAGWYKGGTRYDDDNTEGEEIQTDIISLKAEWTEYFYITFDPNGGTIDGKDENTSVSCDYGKGIDRKIDPDKAWPNKPEKDGRDDIFVGWFDSISNKTFVYATPENINKFDKAYATNPVSIYSDTSAYFTSSRTLKAVFIETVTVKFVTQKGNELKSYTKYVGDYLSENEINDLRNSELLHEYESDPSYKWSGWRTSGGASLNISNKLTLQDNGRSYIAYYDRYATIYYWNMDNKNKPTYSMSVNVPVNTTYDVERQPNIDGYKRMGWFENPNGGGVKYGTKLDITRKQVVYNLYAYYLKYYKVTTNDQKSIIGGTDTETVHLDVVSGSSLYSLGVPPHDDIHVDGSTAHYAFAGWYTEPEGKGSQIDVDYTVSSDMFVYAHWNQGYLVSYYVDGAGAPYTEPYVTEYGTNLILPVAPTIEWADNHGYMGYDFAGWYTEPDGRGTMVSESTKVTSDMDLFGYWVDNPDRENEPHYIVSFNSMGGPQVSSQRVAEHTLLSIPDVGEWTDHKFIGWYKDKDFKEEWNFFEDEVTEDRWLYAKWIDWTEEDEDNAHGIYWVRMLRGGKASVAEYFKESGLRYSYDSNVVRLNKKARTVKGKRIGETLITATKGDGSEYPVKVRAFVLKQELQDMTAFNTSTILNAADFLTVSGFLPDRWESTKTSVAQIDPKTGIITVRGRGSSKIKAYYGSKPVVGTLHCEVPKFGKKFYRFKTGQSKKIKIKKVKKSDIVSWNIITISGDGSGNGGISGNGVGFAEVDNNGRVTAVSAGEVTLQATVYGQTITTKLHIEPPSLKTKQLQINVNKTKRLKLSRTKLKYVEWKSSNENVAYVDPSTGKVYALKTGRATLRTTAGGVTNTCTVIIEDPGASSASTLSKTANSKLKS